jgi:hypothetical protein
MNCVSRQRKAPRWREPVTPHVVTSHITLFWLAGIATSNTQIGSRQLLNIFPSLRLVLDSPTVQAVFNSGGPRAGYETGPTILAAKDYSNALAQLE